jgi:hypothetical protein
MTAQQFNDKYSEYLEEGHYGLDIHNEKVINYLDKEFSKEVLINPNFNYAQIKTKFSFVRVYANSDKTDEWEKHIKEILNKE